MLEVVGKKARISQEKRMFDFDLIKPSNMPFVSKRWGWELWICNNDKYCGKKIFIKKGHHLSYHKHEVKDEVLFVESGKMYFTHNADAPRVSSLEMVPGYATHHSDEDSFRETTDLVNAHKYKVE
jgi:hypothetical protein